MKNFLIKQYEQNNKFKISHNYLSEQFKNSDKILKDIKKLLSEGDFTLGKKVIDLEILFSKLTGTKYAFGVGSGTDAIFLSLKALDLKPGDEVITSSFTFYATIGAIVTAGLKPVFCDIGEDLNIDPKLIEKKITKKTKVILPVHWAGKVCYMDSIMKIANKYNLNVIEDSCHAIGANYKKKSAGSFGISGCFSFHPLKNINVWGDGGIICTNDKKFANKISLLRNHGLINRNECKIFGYNSRLDTLQAIVAYNLIKKNLKYITNRRIFNSQYLDKKLSKLDQINIPQRKAKNSKTVYHLYQIRVKEQKKLTNYLKKKGVDAKIHYPIPIHKQKAYLNKFKRRYKDLNITDMVSKEIISLPVHEFVIKKDLDFMVNIIKDFYKNK
ncbi:DegT/DnrJ/EryC1/StrS family aminotransferase [Candidatus Pelagibacter sp.]|nr:DegT/DnrJ/EryC1/StrS family aminotransferase [Candidatus Pelagibacter sp.]